MSTSPHVSRSALQRNETALLAHYPNNGTELRSMKRVKANLKKRQFSSRPRFDGLEDPPGPPAGTICGNLPGSGPGSQ